MAALQTVDPDIGQAAQAMLQAPQPPPPEPLLTSLINDVAATPRPFVLVLDDYHLIHTLPIHRQLAFLLEHQPPQMHLVIASREDPPLPLSRLRARGQAREIRRADLQFTPEETADFLQQVARQELSPRDVAALQRRTEGWAAGLQLLALSIRGRDDVRQLVRSFTGSHRYVLDYLIEEVFEQQSAEAQDFLLKTSILDRFTAALCDAVTGRNDGRAVLLALDQANLFIVRLDESRQWYRYHRLFADLLRHRLEVASTHEVTQLHRRASQWYAENSLPTDAVRHALAGSDWERAATLILDFGGSMLKRGEVATLLGWFRALPDEVVRAHPRLCHEYSWPLILAGQIEAAEFYLRQAEESAQDDTAFLSDIVTAQAYIARIRGDDGRTIELSRRALSLLPQNDPNSRSIVAVNLGMAHWSRGNLTEAEGALMEAEQAAQRSENHYARLTALSFLGVVQAAQGRLHEAAGWLRQTIQAGGGAPPTALAHDSLSALLYEWNDLEAAADHLERGIELGARSGNVEVQIGGYRILARLRQAQGDASAALDALQQAHELAREKDVPPLMRARTAACHVQIALAQGDLPTAIRWAEQVTEDADGSRFYPLMGLTPARLLLAQGEKEAAAEQLESWHETGVRAGWQYGVVEVRALQALAAPTPDEALAFLADGLALAQPEDYVRTFVDKGEPLAALLREAASQGIAPEYVRRLLAAFARPPTPPRPPTQPLIEPLSDRELDVLHLLADGLTNREIAQALCVSVNTVKTHLSSIYGKLGVHNRHEAAAQAKGLGLVQETEERA